MASDIRNGGDSAPLDRLVAVVGGVDDRCHAIRDEVLHGRFAEALNRAHELVRFLDGDVPLYKVTTGWRNPVTGGNEHEIVSVRAVSRQIAKLEGERTARMVHDLGDFIQLLTTVEEA